MNFQYYWKQKEANFGPPLETEVSEGTHFSIECVLKLDDKYVALRRPQAIPQHEIPLKAIQRGKDCLYFAHDLLRWGETMDAALKRIVLDQTGVGVETYKIVVLEIETYQETNEWSITAYAIVELDQLPTTGDFGNKVTEVVSFDKDTIPADLGWWTREEFGNFLRKHYSSS